MKFRVFGSIVSIVALASGCETAQTTRIPDNSGGVGLTYSVPIRYAKLTLTRSVETVTNVSKLSADLKVLIDQQNTSEKVLEQAQIALATATEIVQQMQSLGISGEALIEAKTVQAKAQEAVNSAKESVDDEERKTKIANIKAALNDSISSKPDPSKWKTKDPTDTLVIELLEPVADPRYRFALRLPHNYFRSEDHKLVVNDNGLLQTADLQTEDKTADVLVGFAKASSAAGYGGPVSLRDIAINNLIDNKNTDDVDLVAKLVLLRTTLDEINAIIKSPVLSGSCTGDSRDDIVWPKGKQIQIGSFVHEQIIDPTNTHEINAFNTVACQLGSNLRFSNALQVPRVRTIDLGTDQTLAANQAGTLMLPKDRSIRDVLNGSSLSTDPNPAFDEETLRKILEQVPASPPVVDDPLDDLTGVNDTSDEDEADEKSAVCKTRVRAGEIYRVCEEDALRVCDLSAGSISDTFACPGLVYRRLLPSQISVDELRVSEGTTPIRVRKSSRLVSLPNASPLDLISEQSSAFVSRTAGLKFSDGTLTELNLERQSEAQQIAGAAFNLVKAPFQAVAEVAKLDVEIANHDKDIAAAAIEIEKLRLEQEERLLSFDQKSLETEIQLDRLIATRDDNLALAILKSEQALALQPLLNDNAITEQLVTNTRTRTELEQLLIAAEVQAINAQSSVTEGELDQSIALIKKQLEFRRLRNELKESEESEEGDN